MPKFVAFDVETRGLEPTYALQPFRTLAGEAWLTSVALAQNGSTSSCLKPPIEYLRRLLNQCAEAGETICAWNAPFDIAWLIALGLREEVYANRWLDGMLLWRHLTSRPNWLEGGPVSYGLKAAVEEFYPDEAGYNEGIDFEADTPEAVEALRVYNERDTEHTLKLCHKFWSELSADQRRAALIEAACLPLVAEAYVNGICMNREAAAVLSDNLTETAKLRLVTLKLNTREEIDDSVLSSPVQLRALLFDKWGLPIPKYTEKGNASTDRDALSLLAPIDARAELLNDYREAKNNRIKFADGTLDSLDYNGDGRSRPVPRVFGTYTGRMSYSSKTGRGKEERPTGVALHQWKRTKEFRDLIEAPPGYTLIELDFAGQEFRWMALFSKDPTMLKMCEPGEDAHAYMGGQIARIPYARMQELVAAGDPKAKNDRQLGKVGNLSCQYRTSARTLERVARVQYGLKLTPEEAMTIWKTYRQTYPRVSRYWKDAINVARNTGYAETWAGRRVQLGTGDTWRDDFRWGLESTALNAPIQGSGADQKYLALAAARDYLPKVDGRFYYELHDGLFFIVPDVNAERAVVELREMLSNLPYAQAWGKPMPIAFPVDAKWGKTWGGLQVYE